LLFPDFFNVVSYFWRSFTSWSVNWKLGVKSLAGFSERILILHCEIKWRRLPGSTIWLTVIQTKGSFDFLCSSNFGCDLVDLSLERLLPADST